jgi:protoheme IX farnesyltransferase
MSESAPRGTARGLQLFVACLELTKPRITGLVVFTSFVGFVVGSPGPVDKERAFLALLGTALIAAGASALNMVLERTTDARMLRTRHRPIPSGRISPKGAATCGMLLSTAGLLVLGLGSGQLAALVAFVTWSSYLFLYTPLKKVTSLATLVGAVPGALPPLIGWAAARGSLDAGGWLLFWIIFVWQVPHFLAIAWLYREDYARGGLRTLSVIDPEGRICGRQSIVYSLALGPISLLPPLLGLAGLVYLIGAVLLDLAVGVAALRFALRRSEKTARVLFLASVGYLAALLTLLLLDRR